MIIHRLAMCCAPSPLGSNTDVGASHPLRSTAQAANIPIQNEARFGKVAVSIIVACSCTMKRLSRSCQQRIIFYIGLFQTSSHSNNKNRGVSDLKGNNVVFEY